MSGAGDPQSAALAFVVAAIPGALIAWGVGFELGAFDVVSYQRTFSIFVVCTVVFVATFVLPDGLASSWWSRLILALPFLYIVSDALLLTDSATVSNVLTAALILTLPYAVWVIARLLGRDLFALSRREQAVTFAVVVLVGLAGFYVGTANERFLTCRDFERAGDFVPQGCAP
ncbi:hypothetical protein [Ilumatobacter sp.]|uniref:hypothetical protein n=1 Tax=Ilumatobacter sp. TaxID=1967498 RepID=UPI003C5AC63A